MKLFRVFILSLISLIFMPQSEIQAQSRRTTKTTSHRSSTKSKAKTVKPFSPKKGVVGEPVDLGLSIKWASWELGASKPEEQGAQFAWGETTQRNCNDWREYQKEKYKFYDASSDKYTKYYFYEEGDSVISDFSTHNLYDGASLWRPRSEYAPNVSFGALVDYGAGIVVRLDDSDDAARLMWGANWRIPTSQEVKELYTKCKWERVGSLESGEPCGWKVTGPNGNYIFMPGVNKDNSGSEYGGGILSSDCPKKDISSFLGLAYNSFNPIYERYKRHAAFSIRPVYVEVDNNSETE